MKYLLLILLSAAGYSVEVGELNLRKIVKKSENGAVQINLYYESKKPGIVEIDACIMESEKIQLFGAGLMETTYHEEQGKRGSYLEINIKYLDKLVLVVVPPAGKIVNLKIGDIPDV